MKYYITQGVIAAFMLLLGITILIQNPSMPAPTTAFEAFGALLIVVGTGLALDLRSVIRRDNNA